MQFIDLLAQYDQVREEVEAAVLRVLRSGKYIMGPEVEQLEAELALFTGVEHVVSCSSGTDALVMALMAKGVGAGDAVFTPPFTFVAAVEAIVTVGATPIFVDVDSATFNIDPEALKLTLESDERLSGLTPRAVIAIDLFGLPADYERINAIATAYGLFVIEDAAQSFGASVGNRRACAFSEIGCTSFFPAKPLGCYGDGGAIFTNDAGLASVLRSIRVHGQGSHKYENVRLGLTGRLDTIQAAVLLSKLKVFERELIARQAVAAEYDRQITAAGLRLTLPVIPNGYTSAWAQYSVLAKGPMERELFMQKAAAAGVPTVIYYPRPLHLQPAFTNLNYEPGDFPVSEGLSERIFSLPMHPYLDDEAVCRTVAAMCA